MLKRSFCALLFFFASCIASTLRAQETLSSINGTVVDGSGAAVSGAAVTATQDQTSLTRSAKSSSAGYFQILNLPVGSYNVTVTRDGFDTLVLPHITVVETRASTVSASLHVGQVATSVTVNENPLLNATDTTNGYTLSHEQIQDIPLATGSFTQLAVLAPGVSAELLAGVGTNAGLGNQPIWANGQRDTSNSFRVDGVDVTNLFNGKSSSQSTSQRLNFNIGEGSSLGGQSQTNTAVAGSNGNGLATPPPEMIQELSVKTSMYDAQGGTNSGAHVDVTTPTGSNKFHGQLYGTRGTNAFNAAPYFFKQDAIGQFNGTIPLNQVNPQLHKELIGASGSGPIIKDKLFFFAGYQFMHDADQFKGFSTLTVPIGLTDDRSTAGLNAAAASYELMSSCFTATPTAAGNAAVASCYSNPPANLNLAKFNGNISPVAAALFNAKLPNGQYLIPSVQNTSPSAVLSGAGNVFLPGSSIFDSHAVVGGLDYNVSHNDRLSAKYFYQHDPSQSPFSVSNTAGFPEEEDSGAQVAAISNSITIGPRISWEQVFGFSRQKVYSSFGSQVPGNFGIGFPSEQLPGLSLKDLSYSRGSTVTTGPASSFVDAGYFQNRWNPSTNLFYTVGRHSFSFGTTYSYTQLNIRNNRGGIGSLTTANLPALLNGTVSSSNYLVGNANRYYRSNESGSYVQDKWQALPNLSITVGVRYDYNGPFSEKNGNMFNFDPSLYSVTDTNVANSGFVVAGNNKFDPTPGVSNSTLTGRQWGIGPRIGFAYSPRHYDNKVVIRGGTGFYYDRGELFSYLSQPAGGSTGGPFGATEAPPLVDYITGSGTRTLANPLGSATVPVPSANPGIITSQLPTAAQIRNACGAITNQMGDGCSGAIPLNFGAYNAANKLPYTINYTFNIQWQPTNDIALTLGYVGNVGRHGVIPVPFNEPGIATPTNPIHGETSSYGYQVLNQNSPVAVAGGTAAKPTTTTYFNSISTEPYNTPDGGNIDLRVPYVGYSPNAALFNAAGVSAYNALQTQVEKRMSHHLQGTLSYTYSHALDEQSDIGLFFTGDNPNRLRDSYGSADFDRTHILSSAFVFTLPDTKPQASLLGKVVNGWQLSGIVIAQSGQPYSLYEFNGAVGSLYFGNFPSLINPVLGIKNGSNPKSALTGRTGAGEASDGYLGAIDVSQLAVNELQPGQKGIPNCTANEPCDTFETDFTPGQRNIFRQAFQKRADVSVTKSVKIGERFAALYSFNVFNLTNTPSFDIPNNSANIGQGDVSTTLKATGNNSYAESAFGQVVTTPGGEGNSATNSGTFSQLYKTPLKNTDGSTTSSFCAVRNTIGSARIIEMQLHLNF
jgi:Carboxypeptidase regulatory-like domain